MDGSKALEPQLPDRFVRFSDAETVNNVAKKELDAYVKLSAGKAKEAFTLYDEILREIQRNEILQKRAIHKGAIYHMMGICLITQRKTQLAFKRFLLAYIEDTLNVEYGKEKMADAAPAGTVLSNWFGVKATLLKEIKEISKRRKLDNWINLRKPEKILDESEHFLGINRRNLKEQYKFKPEFQKTLEYDWKSRVFIGGSYRSEKMATLERIKGFVKEEHFDPIFVMDYHLDDEGDIHHHSLMILHTCRLAIFEVSKAAGQFIELAKVIDYGIPTLILCEKNVSEDLSSMIKTMKGAKCVFYSEDNLEQIVKEFIRENRLKSR